jgi:ribose transport system permease protein
MTNLKFWARANAGALFATALFAAMFTYYLANYSAGVSLNVLITAANKGVLLALVAMAQTLPVLTGGLDLSVGMVFVMANCLASRIVDGPPLITALGAAGVLGIGLAAGLFNGAIVVYGRLQPIITTLATGAIYYGGSLWLRPLPGGSVNDSLADAMTDSLLHALPVWVADLLGTGIGALLHTLPMMLVVLLGVVVVVWVPFARSVTGRACYAAGSAEGAAFMSGVPLDRAKLVAYTLSGLLAATGGLLLTFVTESGEASAPIGGTYTLNSIAAVVIGGTSLYGGAGGAIGSVFGAFVLRTIEDLLFVFDMPPLWQPLFQGVVLLLAVSFGAVGVLRIRNRLDLFG